MTAGGAVVAALGVGVVASMGVVVGGAGVVVVVTWGGCAVG